MLTVSNYHYIRTDFSAAYPSIFGVTPEVFKKQLESLKNQGDIITPLDFCNNYEDLVNASDNFFLLTFDDGLKEQFELALPILDALSAKALFFVNSMNTENNRVSTVHKIHLLRSKVAPKVIIDALQKIGIQMLTEQEKRDAQKCYRFDEVSNAELKYMLNFKIDFKLQDKFVSKLFNQHFNESEVVNSLYMSKSNLQFLASIDCLGSHSHSHYPLGLLDLDALQFELQHSKEYLESLTNKTIQMISYPYGTPEACGDLVAKTAENMGYLYGFTTQQGYIKRNDNSFLLNRFDCNDLIGGKNYIK